MNIEFFLQIVGGIIKDILSNKVRSFLTIFGIVIGIASVTIMVSVGESAQKLIKGTITELVDKDTIVISPGTRDGRTFSVSSFTSSLDFDDYEYIKKFSGKEFKYVSGRTISVNTLTYNDKEISTPLYLIDKDFFNIVKTEFVLGQQFTPSFNGIGGKQKEIIINKSMAEYLFGLSSPLGKEIQIKGSNYTVVGVIKDRIGTVGVESPNEAYVLFDDYGRTNIGLIFVKAYDSKKNRDYAENLVTALLMVNRGIKSKNDIDFTISTQDDIVATSELITGTVTNFIAVISSISLFVGGVGIMNIMLASVKERIKEFGLRKAIGARNSDIMIQVLAESFIYSIIGGIVGSLLGIFISGVIQNFAGLPFVISIRALTISLGVTTMVGLVFGLYPAYIAKKLSPIESLINN